MAPAPLTATNVVVAVACLLVFGGGDVSVGPRAAGAQGFKTTMVTSLKDDFDPLLRWIEAHGGSVGGWCRGRAACSRVPRPWRVLGVCAVRPVAWAAPCMLCC